jgi:hypothetical protein
MDTTRERTETPALPPDTAADLAALHGEFRRAAQLKHIADHEYSAAAAKYEAAAARALLALDLAAEDGYRVAVEGGVPVLRREPQP